MKQLVIGLVVSTIALWLFFAAVLLGAFPPAWLPARFSALELPKTMADFGDSFSTFTGFVSCLAVVLGLIAILIQLRQQADSNIIGAFSARQQFLLAECDRLEQQIQAAKAGTQVDRSLFLNMVEKKKRLLKECQVIDTRLEGLLGRI